MSIMVVAMWLLDVVDLIVSLDLWICWLHKYFLVLVIELPIVGQQCDPANVILFLSK